MHLLVSCYAYVHIAFCKSKFNFVLIVVLCVQDNELPVPGEQFLELLMAHFAVLFVALLLQRCI